MTKAKGHKAAERFDFEEERRTGVLVCTRVTEGAPILHVFRDEDGDWQFLCDGEHGEDGPDAAAVACLECIVADDPSLNDVAGLCVSSSADRPAPGAPWEVHDEVEETIREAVGEHGWFVAKLTAGETEDEPPFAYTVGLHRSYGHPELIILGLDPDVMHGILNVCGERIKGGEKLPVDVPVGGVLDDHDVRLREVRAPESYDAHVGYAKWFNGGASFRLLQVVWPDEQGRFPGDGDGDGDGDVDAALAKQQPLLP